jgi:GGDEF domain-containing protein
MRHTIKRSFNICRWRSEEFAVLLIGTVLMRNEQGQLMFVPALQQPSSQPNSTPGQRIQYVRVSIDMMVSLFAEQTWVLDETYN